MIYAADSFLERVVHEAEDVFEELDLAAFIAEMKDKKAKRAKEIKCA